MLKQILLKIKESLISVLPISLLVLILSFTPLFDLTGSQRLIFILASIFLVIGIALFNLGADMAMSVIGEQVGSALMKSKKLWIIALVLFFMGMLITVAEPDLSVLANQVSKFLNNWALIFAVGAGVGIFLVIAVLKIIFKKDLSAMLIFFYMMLFAITALLLERGAKNFLALSYDTGGVTTGPITVPFIMALGLGIATTIGGRGAKENSFGLVSLCSIGPIIAVLFLGFFVDLDTLNSSGSSLFDMTNYFMSEDFGEVMVQYGYTVLNTIKEVTIALGLVVGFFLIINFMFIKLPKRKMIKIAIGIGYTFLGLVLFLSAASIGFLSVGFAMGNQMATNFGPVPIIIIGFVLGLVVVLAEPAVHVLTHQVEEVTMGGVKKKTMLIALCIGVGISIGLSMIRIYFDFSILYYLIPGYIISLGLSFFVPKIYTSIAFDSGGVASGPLTSSFILPFAIGACYYFHPANLLNDAFGIVAMVAMTPLITIQILGLNSQIKLKVKRSHRLKKINSSDDEQIINFM